MYVRTAELRHTVTTGPKPIHMHAWRLHILEAGGTFGFAFLDLRHTLVRACSGVGVEWLEQSRGLPSFTWPASQAP